MAKLLRLMKDAAPGVQAGIYLRAEKRSKVQFESVLLAPDARFEQASSTLERVLDSLYAKHGFENVDWYVERSLGVDVHGNVAWCNMDLTDALAH